MLKSVLANILAAIRMLVFVVGGAVLIVAHLIYQKFTRSIYMTEVWQRFACWVFGIRVHVYGTPAGSPEKDQVNQPVLYVSNHLSYIDICALGSVLPAVFVAKSEVRDWPIFGYLGVQKKTVFIRRVRTAMEQAIKDVRDRLDYGYDVVVFPEGTSSNGTKVLPFKAGLFELAYAPTARPIKVQPVAVVIEAVDGKSPTTDEIRNQYAWWRPEDTLAPHLWNLAKIWRTDIGLHFLKPVSPDEFASRKELADAAQAAVSSVVEQDNTCPSVPVAQQDRATVS